MRLGARLREDIRTIFERDPAARSIWEVLAYPGLQAIVLHRVAHRIWNTRIPPRGFWKTFARYLSQFSRFITGVEIHPGAKIGRRLFIDHGTGYVIRVTSLICADLL